MREQINGILLLDKPKGFTSHEALQKIKYLFNARKAGHTGSLDPLATGMLPICFGEATKFSQFLLESNKSYRFTVKLGEETDSGDSDGKLTSTYPVLNISDEKIKIALQKFVGEIEQIPPMFSALKYKGQPLYKYARQGIIIDRKTRQVKIFSLSLEKLSIPEIILKIHCSKGTYIRSLAFDLGKDLGCGGHITALRRLSVTPYVGAKMYTLPFLNDFSKQKGLEALKSFLLPIESALKIFPAITLTRDSAFYVKKGQSVQTAFKNGNTLVRLLTEDHQFIGIGKIISDGRVQPHRLLADQRC